jgi:predicted nucleic acid-binding protein
MVSLMDTDVMIDLSRESAEAADYLYSLNGTVLSIVTAQELIVGARASGSCFLSIRSYRHTG